MGNNHEILILKWATSTLNRTVSFYWDKQQSMNMQFPRYTLRTRLILSLHDHVPPMRICHMAWRVSFIYLFSVQECLNFSILSRFKNLSIFIHPILNYMSTLFVYCINLYKNVLYCRWCQLKFLYYIINHKSVLCIYIFKTSLW